MIKVFAAPVSYSFDTLYEPEEGETLIGLDRAAYLALKAGIDLDYAMGDFDSVNDEELSFIKTHAKRVVRFKVRKDKTDSDIGLTKALELAPEDTIIMYGGIGSRLDHTYANLLLLERGNITMRTDHHMARVLKPGTHEIGNPHEYISFFAVEPVRSLTLSGFSFELEAYDLAVNDPLCVSNQGSGTVKFKEGKLLMIASDDE